ncbi:hypothetical protein AB0N14_17465 [Streptomyces sp. NPDC051104]|uniref:hypothetical protein n=1 Tax=Streptomyces sp. NPDC051104 TaxID=3155044 RepID=UPI0034212ADA
MTSYKADVRAALWEQIARLLKSEDVSNTEAAVRLGVDRRFVARVRADLGLPQYQRPPVRWTQERFDQMTRQLRGGHRRWLGRTSPDGVPMASRDESAYRVAFRLHHGRDPVGRVEGTCTRKRCVAGGHQRDDVMRKTAPELPVGLTQNGMDLVAIRRALSGEPPYPPLKPKERRYAFRQADPDLSIAELSARLGCARRTISRWREKGVPA